MAEQKHYTRAPITEAIIDVRVELSADVTLDTLAEARAVLPDYPTSTNIEFFQTHVSVAPELTGTTTKEHIGYALVSEDGRQICQVRLDGFTFNRLAPYEHWAAFRDEARRLWEAYQKITHPTAIMRVAVRTINRLDLPGPKVDFYDFLRTVPEVSSDLPQGLSTYFMQLQIPLPDIDAMLWLNEGMAPPLHPNVVSVILDIDLFREQHLPSDEVALWELFEQLHGRRNSVFEACITDRTRELIR
ncbi:MAG: TIGR04255 family protein [Herpetosiphonaceae bacterium]|nr:TIGR04255 family protein [Herpetosiphonaceae bacterium]